MSVPRKLFKIGEIMRHTGLSRQTVHNYTTLGLITEAERTESGHRLYDESVFRTLERIEELKARHTLQEVRELLTAEGGMGAGGEEGPAGARERGGERADVEEGRPDRD